MLCQPASLSSPCTLAWLSFRESCHDCPADRICATVPSACLRGVALEVGVSGGEECPFVSEAGFGHLRGVGAAGSTVLSISVYNTGVRASQRPGVPGTAEAVGEARLSPEPHAPELVTQGQ